METQEKLKKYKELLENEAAKSDILEQKLQVLRREKEDMRKQLEEMQRASGLGAQCPIDASLLNDSHYLIACRLKELLRLAEDGTDQEVLEYVRDKMYTNEAEIQVINTFVDRYKDYRRTDYKSFCSQYSRIFIYGAGKKAKRCVTTLEGEGIKYEGFVVTNIDTDAKEYLKHKVYSIREIPYKDKNVGILVALNPSNAQQVYPVLEKLKIKNYCYFI